MEKELFSPMAIDALGEMMNISLGSSATAVSNMLDHRVDITTPKVSVIDINDFMLGDLDPAMGVEIKYVEGLEGSNIMLLKRSDVKVIVDILMGTEMPEEEFELNDLTISAVCEVMNQMMGAASTAMSDFLGYPVNISTPEPFELSDLATFKEQHLPQDSEQLVVVRFKLKIEDALESEFMNVMSVTLAKELLAGLGLEDEGGAASAPQPTAQPAPAPQPAAEKPAASDGKLSQEEIERMLQEQMTPAPAPAPEKAPPAPASGGDGGKMSQEEIERLMSGMADDTPPEPQAAPTPQPSVQSPPPTAAQAVTPPPPMYAPAGAQPMQQPPMYGTQPMQQAPMYAQPMQQPPMNGAPMYYQQGAVVMPQASKVVSTQPMAMQSFDAAEVLGKEQAENLDLIMEVPLQVTVEIGRTRRKVQDILGFSKGSLVVLDKLAGDQVDLLVNGKCIARGDVVVIEDNFGVRITEILQKPEIKDVVRK